MRIIEKTGTIGLAGIAVIALLGGAAGGCGSSSGGGGATAVVHDATGGHDASSISDGGGGSSSGSDSGASSRSDGGSGSGSGDGPGDDSGTTDASGSGSGDDGGNGCSPSNPVALTALNSGCSVSVGSTPASNSNTQTICVAAGPVTVEATPASSAFAIGAQPWFGVDQNGGGAASGTDKGTGAIETTTATVTVSTGSRCVSVCCGMAPGGTSCPTTDPCP